MHAGPGASLDEASLTSVPSVSGPACARAGVLTLSLGRERGASGAALRRRLDQDKAGFGNA
jgi:hypothetical protein